MPSLRSSSWCLNRVRPLGRGSSPPRARALRLAGLAASVLIGGFATVAPAALAGSVIPAGTTMVDLGDASTYAVLSGASVGNTVSAAGAPHTTLRGDLGVKVDTRADRLSARRRHRHARGSAPPPPSQAHADLVAAYTEVAARTGGAPLAGALAGTTIPPGLHTVTGAASNTDDGDPRRRGRPERRLRLSGQRRAGHGRRQPCRADQRRPGVEGLLAGQRRRRRRRQLRLRGDADGARRRRHGQRHHRSTAARSLATAPSRSTTTSSTAPRRPSPSPVGPAHITTDTTPTISGTTDVEAPGLVTVTVAGQTLTATPSERRMVGDLGDSGERHLPGRRLGRRRSRQHRQRHPAAHRRHGPAGRQHRRRTVRDDERLRRRRSPAPATSRRARSSAWRSARRIAPRSCRPTGRGTSPRPR